MAVIIQFPVDVNSGLEFKIAHHNSDSDAIETYFPNSQIIPAFIEPHAYIRGNELGNASLIETPDDYAPYAVKVELRVSASSKINGLAKRQELTGLGVFKNGEPVILIQAVHGADMKKLVWTGFDTIEEAEDILNLFSSE